MALFIEFLERKPSGELAYALGSDGFQRLDGRLGIASATLEAKRRAAALRGVGKNYLAFRLYRGERASTARPITRVIHFN